MFNRKKKKTGSNVPSQYTVPPMPEMNITEICQYETPYGRCTKWDNKCDKKYEQILKENKTMLNEFDKYKFIKKSKSELASDEIINRISQKLWDDSGYNVVYMLGIINYLSAMAKQMRSYDTYSKKDLTTLIASIKNGNETPDEIKNLVDIVLEELNKKDD